MTAERERMGSVVGGSLTKSIEVRLEPGKSAGLGEYLVSPLPEGGDLLGMVTDVLLKSAEAGATSWPPGADDGPLAALLREVLLDTGVYTAVEVNPYLEVEADGATARARRLPRHFARVTRADQEILNRAFAVDEERGELVVDARRARERRAVIGHAVTVARGPVDTEHRAQTQGLGMRGHVCPLVVIGHCAVDGV